MRVAFWATSSLEPDYEAVSKEVFFLAEQFRGSWIFSVSPHLLLRFSLRRRYAGITARAYPVSRAVIPALERAFDVSHVYGHLSPWLFHKSLRRTPIVHTVTEGSGPVVADFLDRCSAIVAQTAATRDRIVAAGIPMERVHLWYPGVDLARFHPRPRGRAPGPGRILFATAPRTRGEMQARGVHLVLAAARLADGLHFRLLYRPWRSGYSSLAATRRAIAEAELRNVELTNFAVPRMQDVYPEHDLTVIPYTTSTGGKECPSSALESLACGVPVLASSKCGFSRFIEENRCGVVFEPTPEGLLEAAERAMADGDELSKRARATAVEHLDAQAQLRGYEQLYRNALKHA